MRKALLSALVLCLCAVPRPVLAQTAWDSPMLLPPGPPDGFGIYLTQMHRADLGVMGTWRSPTWNYGLRVGIADGSGTDGLALFGGVDYSGPLHRATNDLPLDIDWLFGAGLGTGNGIRASFPAGVSVAHSFQAESARFTPYLTPRLVLDGLFGGTRVGGDQFRLGLAADIGVDMRITSGGGPLLGSTLRFGASVGDRSAIALGIVF
jgi:hypothetical protein